MNFTAPVLCGKRRHASNCCGANNHNFALLHVFIISRKSLPRNSLVDVKFTVFGMGDSGYDKFNAVARYAIYIIYFQCRNPIPD